MANPTRFTSGVSTADKGTTNWNFPMPDPTKVHVYFEDFLTYAAGDFTKTVIGTGDNALVADDPFGALASTNSAADNDGVQNQVTVATFTPVAGKKIWFKSRFKISDATQSDFIIGLCVLDTTALGAVDGDGLTDGMFFSKEDGDTQLDVNIQKNTTTGQNRATNIATVDTSYVTVGLYYDGVSEMKYYVNDVQIGTLAATSAYLPDTALAPTWGLLNGEAVAKEMTVDYLFAAIER